MDSSKIRVCVVQLIVGLAFLNQGSPRIMFSFFAGHNVEGYFLGKSLDVNEQITGILDVSIFVMGVVSIPSSYRNGEFCGGKVMLLDKVSVYAGDVCTTIDQCLDINDFH